MKRFMNKKVVAIGLAVGLTLGAAGAAFAYFTSTGSGNGSVTTGSATNWTVTASAHTGTTLFPGVGSEVVPFTITNAGTGDQALTSEVFSVANDGSGNVTTGLSNTPVVGCLATWYSLTPGTVSPANATTIAPAGTATDSVTVILTNASVSQNACQGVTPNITLTVA
jgi:hypothetical protein